jgi:hypothetical protein
MTVPLLYKMAIKNVARYIASPRNLNCEDGAPLDGYRASEVLSVAFCKAKEEILADILRANGPETD